MNRILTWHSPSNSGAVQVDTMYGYIFSDRIDLKPIFSFTFTDLYYNENDGRYTVDDTYMTEEQKAEISNALNLIEPPIEWVKQIKGMTYTSYLADTSWYIERLNDPSSGKPIPEEVLSKRTIAREQLSLIKKCSTIEQLNQLGGIAL